MTKDLRTQQSNITLGDNFPELLRLNLKLREDEKLKEQIIKHNEDYWKLYVQKKVTK